MRKERPFFGWTRRGYETNDESYNEYCRKNDDWVWQHPSGCTLHGRGNPGWNEFKRLSKEAAQNTVMIGFAVLVVGLEVAVGLSIIIIAAKLVSSSSLAP